MAKNKKIQNDRRAKKAATKEAKRRKEKHKGPAGVTKDKRKRVLVSPSVPSSAPPTQTLSEEDLWYWKAHGVNFLASDYQTGTWIPVFPDLYEGVTPTKDALARKLLSLYDEKDLDGPAKYIMAWAMSPSEIIWAYKTEALRRLSDVLGAAGVTPSSEELEEEAKRPHQPVVWTMFQNMRDAWAAHLSKE